MLILMELALLYGGVLTCHTELRRMYSLTRSRSIWFGNFQDVWMVLWNGTGHAQTGYSITSGSLGVAY